MFYFIIITMAIWRITSLFVNEVGPFKMFERIRTFLNTRLKFTRLFINTDCMWCLSVYISFIFALFTAPFDLIIIYTLAYATGVIVLDAIIEKLT